MSELTPLPLDPARLGELTFNETGLIPTVVQSQSTKEVLMLAWMNREALEQTFKTGRMWYWSRSRQELWCKGETSGDRQYLREAFLDCDGDTLLFKIEQTGQGACHTGAPTCFFRSMSDADN
ncbi:MAG: phosphoribosyl-AMP cyclohydrolase [Acidimicrobiia bacterium]